MSFLEKWRELLALAEKAEQNRLEAIAAGSVKLAAHFSKQEKEYRKNALELLTEA